MVMMLGMVFALSHFTGHLADLKSVQAASSEVDPSQASAVRPELVLQTGHALKVDGIAFSPDGHWLASGSADSTIKLWDVATGHELRTLTGHTGWVRCLCFNPDGRIIASGGADRTIKLWDTITGVELRTLTGHTSSINSVAFSPDGRWLASASADKTIKLWDASTGTEARTLSGHTGWVTALAFNNTGQLLASGSADATIKLWNTATGNEVRTLIGHTDRVRSVAFSPDGELLAAGSSDKSVRLWKTDKGKLVRTLSGNSSPVLAVAFTTDGNSLLSGSADKTVKVWETSTGRETRTVTDTSDAPAIESMMFSAGGKYLASSSGNRMIDLREPFVEGTARVLKSHAIGVYSVAFSANGRWFASGSKDNTIKLWDASAGNEVCTLKGHIGFVTTVAFTPDSQLLASGSLDHTIKLWETSTGHEVRTLRGHSGSVNSIALSADGSQLASASADKTVKLWDIATGQEIRTLAGHTAEVNSIAFSFDKRLLASASADKTVKLWDATTGTELRTLAGHDVEVYAIAFNSDGRLLASASKDHTVKVWDAATGRESRTLQASAGRATSVAFSGDGKLLAAGSSSGTLKLWEVTTGAEVHSLIGHTDTINDTVFSPDNRILATCSEDGSARLWDVGSGTLLATLVSLRESSDWLVVAPDGLFDGSPAAWNQILWRFTGSTFDTAPVEAFFNEYFYPELLADILANRQPKAAQDISERDRRQPDVKLFISDSQTSVKSAANIRVSDARSVPVKLEIKEAPADGGHLSGSGARDVRLFRNGSLVHLWRGDVTFDKSGRAVLETSVQIVAGENRFTAYAFNRDNVKSIDAASSITGADSLKRDGTTYILAIGINKYANRQYNLKYAVVDAQLFTEELRRQQSMINRSARVEIIPLLNEEGTKANILLALKRLSGEADSLPASAPEVLRTLKAAQPEDSVMVYYAGHGTAQAARFYLIPHDLGYMGSRQTVDEGGLSRILNRSVSDVELEQAFEKIDAGEVLLVIDACNSGQALDAAEKRRGPMNSRGLAQLAYEKGMYILTAAQSYQAALEVKQFGHGLMTYALVDEGLKRGLADDDPHDGLIETREWLDYATLRVPQLLGAKLERARAAVTINAEPTADEDEVQRPRLFYRREAAAQPLIIGSVAAQVRR
jgi:WD40 repeat protein